MESRKSVPTLYASIDNKSNSLPDAFIIPQLFKVSFNILSSHVVKKKSMNFIYLFIYFISNANENKSL